SGGARAPARRAAQPLARPAHHGRLAAARVRRPGARGDGLRAPRERPRDRLRRGARGRGDRGGVPLHRPRDPALRRYGGRAGRGRAPRLIRLTLALGFCYARRAFVSITTAAFYLLAI